MKDQPSLQIAKTEFQETLTRHNLDTPITTHPPRPKDNIELSQNLTWNEMKLNTWQLAKVHGK